MKNLTSASKLEQEQFFNSFDQILCDVDGVLWYFQQPIPGSDEAIKSLKDLGKKIIYVSNNSTKSHEDYCKQFKTAGYELNTGDLVVPVLAMIDYLKSQNFTKQIYLVGMTSLRRELENAGFTIAENATDSTNLISKEFVHESLKTNKDVGAVIFDIDFNMNMVKLQRAAMYLKNPEVLFIVGGSESQLCTGPETKIIGPGCFHEIIEQFTGRTPISMAKPSPHLRNYINKHFNIIDPGKVLFIGDTIVEDMGFATLCGYKKLLVLSGSTKEESLSNWKCPEDLKPDYYVQSLADIRKILTAKS